MSQKTIGSTVVWNASCFLTPSMSGFRLKHSVSNEQQEIVIVTTKQYLAVADDFLCRLFPEFTPDRPPYRGPFTVFISDDDHVVH